VHAAPVKTYTDRITVTGGLESVPRKLSIRTAFPEATSTRPSHGDRSAGGRSHAVLRPRRDVADPEGLTALLETLA